MKKLQHVFFDLDHTLWDFEKNATEALNELFDFYDLKNRGVHSFEHFYEKYAEINNKMWELYRKGEIDKHSLRTQRFENTFREFGFRDEEIPGDLWEHYLRITPEKTNLIPGAFKLLNDLSRLDIRMHIITNGFAETQKRKLEAAKIRHFFTQLIISEEIGFQKPMPQIFHAALKMTGAETSNSLYVGDHPEADIQGSINVGLPVVFFNPGDFQHQMPVFADVRELDEILPILVKHYEL